MRIQNNITAMNTHRQYTINNDNVAKAAEKLSSGYRINRAGDDAAGLAISEKMRSQIRGLNMAAKNSQDAISLVQTAEGALQETQNMLQRMNELAVQAATGTNEELDRTALAKEFEQLKREINDIAEQTTFNNMKVLDGSLSYNGPVRSAATSGINMTVAKDATSAIAGISGVSNGTAAAKVNEQIGSITMEDATGLTVVAGEAYRISITSNGKDVTNLKSSTGTELSEIITKAGATNASLADFHNATFEIDGVTFKLDTTTTDKKITITQCNPDGTAATGKAADVDWEKLGIEVKLTQVEQKGGVDGYQDVAGGKSVAWDYSEKDATTKAGIAGADAGKAVTTFTVDSANMKNGDTVKIGNKTYTFYTAGSKELEKGDGTSYVNGEKLADNSIAIVWDGKSQESNLGAQLNAVLNGDAEDAAGNPLTDGKIAATAAGTTPGVTVQHLGKGQFVLTGDYVASGNTTAATGKTVAETQNAENVELAKSASDAVKVEFNAKNGSTAETTRTTIEFDTAKMKEGDTFTFKVDGKEATFTYKEADLKAAYDKAVQADPKADPTMANVMANLVKDALVEQGVDADKLTAKGNALIVDDLEVKETGFSWDEANDKSNAIRIQVGALENEQLAVSIDAMNTAGLKLDAHGLDTQESAGRAITAVRSAINKVSDQRATLGAMQNRLDHKIANLKVSSENLSAAESRIRDVDMASEMTNFTKNNILSQAATAMLAQANALPQNVLSLLG